MILCTGILNLHLESVSVSLVVVGCATCALVGCVKYAMVGCATCANVDIADDILSWVTLGASTVLKTSVVGRVGWLLGAFRSRYVILHTNNIKN